MIVCVNVFVADGVPVIVEVADDVIVWEEVVDDVGVDERVVVLVVVYSADSDEQTVGVNNDKTVCVAVAIELGVKPLDAVYDRTDVGVKPLDAV